MLFSQGKYENKNFLVDHGVRDGTTYFKKQDEQWMNNVIFRDAFA
jgi:hypothetical protein